jgi:hypothetical protein
MSLDSATMFLFNHDVRSLAAGLIYPPGTSESISRDNHMHPSNQFARAFTESQLRISYRSIFGSAWPLTEITGDKTKENMRIVDEFINPIVEAALRKKDEERATGIARGGGKADVEHQCLLDHLVSMTNGKSRYTIKHWVLRVNFLKKIYR